MAPPQLPRNAPIADVAHPVKEGLRPGLGDELGLALLHRLDCRLRERLHLHEPLGRQHRLDHRFATLAVADRVHVRLGSALEPQFGQPRFDRFARLETIQPRERTSGGGDHTLLVEDRDHRQVVAQAAFEVVGIVGGRDLHRAGAELGIDQHRIGDDLELIPGDRVFDRLADFRPVARIIRMHGHRRVAEHGLGPRGRDHDLAAAVGQRIGELVELALHALVVVDLEVRERGPARHAPVDQAARAVDQALFVEADEGLDHRRRVRRVHREDRSLPVERAAEQLELAQDAVAGAAAPVPDPLDERLAPDVVARLAFLLAQLALDHHLRGDAGVIHAGQPHGVVRGHALPAREDIFNRVAERVPHVQRTGYVGRRE